MNMKANQCKILTGSIAVIDIIPDAGEERIHINEPGYRIKDLGSIQKGVIVMQAFSIDEVAREADNLAHMINRKLGGQDVMKLSIGDAASMAIYYLYAIMNDLILIIAEGVIVDMPAHILIRLPEYLGHILQIIESKERT